MMTATQYFNKEFIHNILEPAFEFNEFFIVDSDNNIYELDTKDIKLSENNIIINNNKFTIRCNIANYVIKYKKSVNKYKDLDIVFYKFYRGEPGKFDLKIIKLYISFLKENKIQRLIDYSHKLYSIQIFNKNKYLFNIIVYQKFYKLHYYKDSINLSTEEQIGHNSILILYNTGTFETIVLNNLSDIQYSDTDKKYFFTSGDSNKQYFIENTKDINKGLYSYNWVNYMTDKYIVLFIHKKSYPFLDKNKKIVNKIGEYVKFLNNKDRNLKKCDIDFLKYSYDKLHNHSKMFNVNIMINFINYSVSDIRRVIDNNHPIIIKKINTLSQIDYYYCEIETINPYEVQLYNVSDCDGYKSLNNGNPLILKFIETNIYPKKIKKLYTLDGTKLFAYNELFIMKGNMFRIKNNIPLEQFKTKLTECIPIELYDENIYIIKRIIGGSLTCIEYPSKSNLLQKYPEHYDYLLSEYIFNLNNLNLVDNTEMTVLHQVILKDIFKSKEVKSKFLNIALDKGFNITCKDSRNRYVMDLLINHSEWNSVFKNRFTNNMLFLNDVMNTTKTEKDYTGIGQEITSIISLSYFLQKYREKVCPFIVHNKIFFKNNESDTESYDTRLQINTIRWIHNSTTSELRITPYFNSILVDCLKNSSRFIIIMLILDGDNVDNKTTSYNNTIIIDKVNFNIERYDYYGETGDIFNSSLLDEELQKIFIKNQDSTNLPSNKLEVYNTLRVYERSKKNQFTYDKPKNACPTNSLKMHKKEKSDDSNNVFCHSWSIYYTQLRLENPDIPTDKLLKIAHASMRDYRFNIFINQYTYFLKSMLIEFRKKVNELSCRDCINTVKEDVIKSNITHENSITLYENYFIKMFD